MRPTLTLCVAAGPEDVDVADVDPRVVDVDEDDRALVADDVDSSCAATVNTAVATAAANESKPFMAVVAVQALAGVIL